MDIGRTEGVPGPGRIEGIRVEGLQSGSIHQARAAADRLDISEVGRLTAEALSMPAVRLERVEGLRHAIETGTYLVEPRLFGAIEGFLLEFQPVE